MGAVVAKLKGMSLYFTGMKENKHGNGSLDRKYNLD
jgi:hypothetical protein